MAEAAGTDSEEEVLVVMDLADLPQVSAGGASVHDSEGGVDLRTEGFWVGEATVDSVIAVSVGEIAISAIAGLIGTLSVLASMALDTHTSPALISGANFLYCGCRNHGVAITRTIAFEFPNNAGALLFAFRYKYVSSSTISALRHDFRKRLQAGWAQQSHGGFTLVLPDVPEATVDSWIVNE